MRTVIGSKVKSKRLQWEYRMRDCNKNIRKDIAEGKKEVIHFARPFMWSHVEYAKALIARYEYISADQNLNK